MSATPTNLAERKLNLIQLLSSTDDEAIIAQIEGIFSDEKINWDELNVEVKDSINRGIKDADEGRKIPFSEFVKKRRNQ